MGLDRRPGSRFLSPSGRAIVALGGILIAAVLAITTYEIWRQRTNALDGAEAALESLSLALAEQTERSFHSVDLVLAATITSIANAGGLAAADPEALHRSLRERTSGVPLLTGLLVTDREGRVVASARPLPAPISLADRSHFRHHRDNPSGALLISKPVRTPVDGSVIIPVTRRLTDDQGHFAGTVIAAVDPGFFENFYSRVLPGNEAAFALFHADGTLLARAPAAAGAIGQNFSHLPALQPGRPDRGMGFGPSPIDGRYRILSYNRLKAYPLMINVSQNQDAILAPWRENTVRLTLAAVLAVVILAAAVVILYRQDLREERHAVALRRSEERLRLAQFALDHAADMVLWLDGQGRVVYANHAAFRRLGFTETALLLTAMGDIDPGLRGAGWTGMLEAVRTEGQVRMESEFVTASGQYFPVETVLSFVDFGPLDLVCAFARDITARRAAEAALAEKTARLEASNAELEQFAYVASHDLREPLRMVNSFVTILARRYADVLDQDGREFIGFVQDGAVRMDRLILDLLEYSRVGRIERPLAPMPLGRAVDVAVKGLMVAASEAGATVTVAHDLPAVTANEEELGRLLLNLIGNAIKYRSPDRPCTVRVGAERRGDEVLCRIDDNGIGIAPEYFERIFRIFQRLHGRDKYDGTGIGLAICKKIVERHGGRIWVESVPGEGSTFFFTLKAAECAPIAGAAKLPEDAPGEGK